MPFTNIKICLLMTYLHCSLPGRWSNAQDLMLPNMTALQTKGSPIFVCEKYIPEDLLI